MKILILICGFLNLPTYQIILKPSTLPSLKSKYKISAITVYDKMLYLEERITSFFKYPNVTIASNMTQCLEEYNQLFNYVVIKIKIKDRVYLKTVTRLLQQSGPTFLHFSYTFDFLMENWGWTRQQVVNFRCWLTDTWYLWFLFKRSVERYKYPLL